MRRKIFDDGPFVVLRKAFACRAVLFFDEDRGLLADQGRQERRFLAGRQFIDEFDAPFLFRRFDLVLHIRCRRPLALGIREGVDMREREAFQRRHGVLEEGFRFAGKTQDEVRRDSQAVDAAAQAGDEVLVFSHRVMAVHGLQDRVRTGLEGQVQMRADAVRAVHDVDHVVADFQGLDGTQTDAGHVGFLDQAVQDVGQRRMVVEIAAIGAEVDAGQDDFLEARCDQAVGFGDDGVGLARFQSAPRIGNDAVGTEIVAPFLDLQVGPRVFHCRRIEGDFLEFIVAAHVVDGRDGFIVFVVQEFADNGYDALAFIGPDDGVDFGHGRQKLRVELGIAAGDDDLGRIVALLRPPDELARFLFADLSDRTGIDDIDVGRAIEIGFREACSQEEAAHTVRIVLIDTAAKSGKSDSWHYLNPLSYIMIDRAASDAVSARRMRGPRETVRHHDRCCVA